jgi:O-antigen/teichoic acid export membrane protein
LKSGTREALARDGAGTASITETGAAQGRHMAVGTLRLLSVHTLLLPLGLLTTVFLTRQLGPELYGVFAVAASIVIWVRGSITRIFGQTTVKFVAEAADWRKIASALTQAQLVVSLGAAALLLAAAPVLASWLKSPELTAYLRLFALEIPIFSLARVHLSILTGRGAFGRVAFLTAVYGLSRMMLVFLLVGSGLSLTGAILANIGASLAQLIAARVYVRPAIPSRAAIPVRRIASYSLPLFLSVIGMRLLTRLDLLVVKALSGTPAAAGYYSAAQSLTVPFGLFVASFSAPLLATLTRALQHGQTDPAHSIIRQAMRLVLCFLPFAGAAAGSAPEIISLVYGRAFLPTAPLLALLLFGAVANVMTSVTTGVLTAAGRPGWTFALIGPLLPLALGAHLALVPRFGPIGAAAVTTVLAWLGASAAMLVIRRQYGVYPAPATLLRIAVTTLAAYALSSIWHTSGAWVILELLGIAAITLVCLFLVGELTGQDLAFGRSLLRREGKASI